jgi:hypothetical protein
MQEEYGGCTHLLSHASGTKGLREGIVFENTIGCVLLVGISPAFGMPQCCSMRLFPIVSWAFRRGTGIGGSVRLGARDMGRSFRTVPWGMGAVVEAMFGVFGCRELAGMLEEPRREGAVVPGVGKGCGVEAREGGTAALSARRTTSHCGHFTM